MTPQQTPRHVLWICRWYPNREDPQLGVFIRKQAEALAEHMRVTVVYAMPVDKGPFETVIRQEGHFLEIVRYYPKKKTPPGRWIAYAVAIQGGIAEAVRRHGRPALALGYILKRSGIMARRIARTFGIPFVIAEQWSGYASGDYRRRGWNHRRIARHLCAEARGVMVVSDFLQSAMERMGIRGRFSVMPNIVETATQFSEAAPDKAIIEILLVADLVDRIKNVSAVIRAMSELQTRQPNARLRIIGDGPDRAPLENLVRELKLSDEQVRFMGRLPNTDVYRYLAQADFLVMNSRVETFSLICAEAMSCGKPVLATRCGGPEGFVGPEDGILIDPDQPEALVKALERMCDTFRSYDAEQIRRHATERFSKAAVGRQLADLMEHWISTR